MDVVDATTMKGCAALAAVQTDNANTKPRIRVEKNDLNDIRRLLCGVFAYAGIMFSFLVPSIKNSMQKNIVYMHDKVNAAAQHTNG
ncbi:MAG: hypothetical protein H0V62_12135 [Gammaproteobacteria bacterium]|nr:hypothetical protein [Gammaproteobacteria bacterium]